jgi:predicted Zn-dependent protease
MTLFASRTNSRSRHAVHRGAPHATRSAAHHAAHHASPHAASHAAHHAAPHAAPHATHCAARRSAHHARPLLSLGAVPLVLSLVLLLSCATNPVTGKRQLMLVSEAQEDQIGAQSDTQIVAQYGVVQDPGLASYIEQLGNRLVTVSHRPDLKFHFRLLDDPTVNAFALPGGYVYITRGILAYLPAEAALAGVMGHEIGHVAARHGAQQMTQQQLIGLGLGLGAALNKTFAQYSGIAGQAAQLLMLKYSRDDERQADQLGVEYATKIHYDTQEMANFFQTLERLTADAGRLPAWQSTHPDPGERYVTVGQLTRQWQGQVGAASYLQQRDTYVGRLEGIVFGSNPRGGYVKDGVFLHPDLALQFPVPPGWAVANAASQVALTSKDGEAMVLFGMEQSQTDPAAAADAFARGQGIQISERTALRIHELAAVRLAGSVTTDQGDLGLVSTFIKYDGRVYAFHGLTALNAMASMRPTLVAPANGFGPLTDRAALGIQPTLLHVVESPKAAPFREAVSGFPIPDGAGIDLAGLALVNGMGLDTPVAKGQLLKVLRRRSAS